ncbi:TetR/AcrR family transcriptional regulator [Pseudenterobacter timonensis]|uniref:TetR/AcrR family transcriptional regulator n=1 Tax=Pseudenterobacter timonensis TaxID=1755099 RepID=A0AAE4DQD8_9ENTR|nr:TetR/AcrR family transcriptional regulator [Pseudenterobacter timonensis]MDR9891928.1 TetR/AcrR family transcriptional regulator [Pseudenterobacter timonensis]
MTAQTDNSRPGSAGRRPGRPRGGQDNAARRERLLDIALSLFSRQGMAQTSLNAIAKEAGVTPAMLNYYFNSREQLLDAMIEERFLPLRSEIVAVFKAHPDDPVTALTQTVQTLARLAERHAWFAPLWMQEVIGEMSPLRAHLHARWGEEEYRATLALLIRWQQEGKLNPALAPELLFTTLLSLVLVPFSRMRNDERLTSLSPETIVRHALAVTGAGMAG